MEAEGVGADGEGLAGNLETAANEGGRERESRSEREGEREEG